MPASSRARVFTQAPWWSRLGRNTGRSGTIASRSAATGVPPGKAAIAQPPPRIHGTSGWESAYALTTARYSSRVRRLGQVAAGAFEPALHRVHVRVDEPGRDQAARHVDDSRTGRVRRARRRPRRARPRRGRSRPRDGGGRRRRCRSRTRWWSPGDCAASGGAGGRARRSRRRAAAPGPGPQRPATGRRRSLMPTARAAKANATEAAATVKKTLIQRLKGVGVVEDHGGLLVRGVHL